MEKNSRVKVPKRSSVSKTSSSSSWASFWNRINISASPCIFPSNASWTLSSVAIFSLTLVLTGFFGGLYLLRKRRESVAVVLSLAWSLLLSADVWTARRVVATSTRTMWFMLLFRLVLGPTMLRGVQWNEGRQTRS